MWEYRSLTLQSFFIQSPDLFQVCEEVDIDDDEPRPEAEEASPEKKEEKVDEKLGESSAEASGWFPVLAENF